MLAVNGLNAWYGRSHVIQDISFEVARGEIVTLLGRNGAGKSTTIRSIMGLVEKRPGSVLFEGTEILPRQPLNRFTKGLPYVPQHRTTLPALPALQHLP